MNSTDVMAVLRDIESVSSRTAKDEIFARAVSDGFFADVVRYALDPFITYGITPPVVETQGKATFDENSALVVGLLNALSSREITGNEARQTVLDTMMLLNQPSCDLLWRILSKDLRCGIGASTINRLIPGLIPSFSVMLAHGFESKRVKSWPVAVEPKIDGVRVICLARDGKAQFFSRSGKPFTAVEHLSDAVMAMLKAADLKEIALDGEIVSGDFNKTVGDIRRKSEQAQDVEYHIFDALDYAGFMDLTPAIKVSYKDRRAFAAKLVSKSTSGNLKLMASYMASNEDEIWQFYETFQNRGLEGAMVKPLDGFYDKKRSYSWLKLKGCESIDLIVSGHFEGSGKYTGTLGGLIVDNKGVEVRVGGGFTDAQRHDIWSARAETVGRMIEIEFHQITSDGSLRHPRFLRFRDEPDNPGVKI